MTRMIQLDGLAAIDHIVARAAPFLSKLWDGTTERVAFIEEREGEQMRVGYWSRGDAAAEARKRALDPGWSEHARVLAEIVGALERGPRTGGVQCVILGWGGCNIIEINPEDLKHVPELLRAVSDEDLVDLYEACSTREGAERALGEVRLLWMAEKGEPFAELAALADVVEQRWGDVGAIAIAVARARAANDAWLATRLGQKTRDVLDMLGEATAKRGGGGVNSRGGAA